MFRDIVANQGQGDENGEMEVVIKPRTNFSSSALRRAVPQTDLKKKRESLTMSMINIYKSGSSQRLFQSGRVETQSNRAMQSCNLVAKHISFASPRGKEISKAVNKSSQKIAPQPSQIDEENSEGESSEKSDATSSSCSSESSIDAALNGEGETEEALYEKILAAQENRDNEEEAKTKES